MCQYPMPIGQLHAEHGVGQILDDGALNLNDVVLGHTPVLNPLADSRRNGLQGFGNLLVGDLGASFQSESQRGIRPAEYL